MICRNCGAETRMIRTNMGQDLFFCPVCSLLMIDFAKNVSHVNPYDKLLQSVQEVRRINFNRILNTILSMKSDMHLSGLEVGCAQGDFMDLANSRGIEMTGIEPMEESYEAALQKGLHVLKGLFPQDFPDTVGQFDFIIFNDVFEHIPESREVVEKCTELLKPDGLLIINLPMSGGFTYHLASLFDHLGKGALLRRLYQLDTSSPHVLYYNRKSIRSLMSAFHFEEIHRSQRMKSYTLDSVRERIDAVPMNLGKAGKIFFQIGAYLAYPLMNLLPADTRVFYFGRSHEFAEK